MAKDGSARGGTRARSGAKKKAAVDKVKDGKVASVIQFANAERLEAGAIPPMKEFLKEDQKEIPLEAEEVFNETWQWLKDRGCSSIVSVQMVEQYAMSVARWIQCERFISKYGFLGKHPTTGVACTSPYVAISQQYMKQVNNIWSQIFQLVRENSTVGYAGPTPQDDVMEKLLRVQGV